MEDLQGLAAHARWLRRVAGEGGASVAVGGRGACSVPGACRTTKGFLSNCDEFPTCHDSHTSCYSAGACPATNPAASPVDGSFAFGGPHVLDALNTLCGVNVQRIDVARRGLAAVSEALEGMESVASLKLSGNTIRSGWERLRSLHQLRELELVDCGLTEVLEALAGMESMTSLNMSGNPIKNGWERLRSLRRLREVHPTYCTLTELPEVLAGP